MFVGWRKKVWMGYVASTSFASGWLAFHLLESLTFQASFDVVRLEAAWFQACLDNSQVVVSRILFPEEVMFPAIGIQSAFGMCSQAPPCQIPRRPTRSPHNQRVCCISHTAIFAENGFYCSQILNSLLMSYRRLQTKGFLSLPWKWMHRRCLLTSAVRFL